MTHEKINYLTYIDDRIFSQAWTKLESQYKDLESWYYNRIKNWKIRESYDEKEQKPKTKGETPERTGKSLQDRTEHLERK